MSDETYDVILKALKGEFNVPVAQRSRTQRAALVRLWRNRQLYALSEDGQAITFAGKLVAKKSTIPTLVNRVLDETKGSGARKVNIHLTEEYSGISRASVQGTLDRSRRYHLHKMIFGNKPIPKSIKAKAVQDLHQIDFLDMGKWRVSHGQATYRYILTIVDVFSRYIWLRPLKSKHSAEIAKHLEDIYSEHGPPKILQHDQGKEFKGAVRKLMESLQAIQEAERHRLSFRKPDRTPTGVDPQPGPLADPEPGLQVDLEPYLLANPEPGPVADLEPGPLAHPEPGPLANPEDQSMANPLVDMVVNPDNEHGAQYLPSEIL
ncbi:SCAN domain-containing protein 3 [Acipenser ruthenus]|uniref:SCAN domain-containing protein 3 n=1 Tax=Acipenser ruthenus TaxID=7906 RepID=A0A662YXR1_ACIRT|nr:SCAN domain-containing protein 3 [Acipenser ruthenus]